MRYPRLLLAFAVSAVVAFAAAACSKSDSAPSAGACTVTVGSVPTALSAAATSGTIPVTAGAGCAWTAASSAAFITATPASGTGNGSVAYTVAANTGAARSGSISISTNVINFVQQPPQAPTSCTITLSAATARANSGGGTVSVDVTGAATCGWSATSNSSFLTVTSGATGTSNGTVTITAAANTGKARSGTVTIGGLTFTVTQDDGVVVSFQMTDPSQTIGPVTSCNFRSSGAATTCTLTSTSSTGQFGIVSYTWAIQYTYVTIKTINVTSQFPSTTFSDSCGQAASTADGVQQPLAVTLTVTDSNGNTASASAGSGSQPPLFVALFTCGS